MTKKDKVRYIALGAMTLVGVVAIVLSLVLSEGYDQSEIDNMKWLGYSLKEDGKRICPVEHFPIPVNPTLKVEEEIRAIDTWNKRIGKTVLTIDPVNGYKIRKSIKGRSKHTLYCLDPVRIGDGKERGQEFLHHYEYVEIVGFPKHWSFTINVCLDKYREARKNNLIKKNILYRTLLHAVGHLLFADNHSTTYAGIMSSRPNTTIITEHERQVVLQTLVEPCSKK